MWFNKKYNVLILGSNGMLGHDVFKHFTELSKYKHSGIGLVHGLDVQDKIDFTWPNALDTYLKNGIHYDYCINCIAYTNTNAAENTKEGWQLSYELNALVPKYLARSCRKNKIKLIHISTDYVFSEYSRCNDSSLDFLCSNDETFPCNAYGTHKLFGELFIQNEFGDNLNQWTILRTSWLYGSHNNKSFIHKFMKNVVSHIAQGITEVDMTSNELSIPASTNFVVETISYVIDNNVCGIRHAVPLAGGPVSRLEFAKTILNAFDPLDEVFGVKIRNVTVKGVERETFQPKHSTMMTSFHDIALDWKTYVNAFVYENKEMLLK